MDICFNRYIPKSTESTLIIRPSSKTFVNGMAESYSYQSYDAKKLDGILSQREFEAVLEQVNNAIFNEYPCPGCQCFAYCCCLCTLGLSCIIPLYQVNSARKNMIKTIDRINKELEKRKLKMEHYMEKSTSYIVLYLPNHEIFAQCEQK